MTSKYEGHTPGPWWVDDDGYVAAGSGDTYTTVADVNLTEAPGISDEEREANATLIADAPLLLAQRDEMAEALRKMVEWYDATRFFTQGGGAIPQTAQAEYAERVQATRTLLAQRDEMAEALRGAVYAIEGLADQQAMPDDSYKPALVIARASLAKLDEAKP